MFMPAQYAWAEPVVIAALVVFIISWIGNSVIFGNKFLNALATAVVFGLVFGALAYFRVATLSITSPDRETVPVAKPASPVPPGNPVATVPAN
jgi:apolipoprotein N-acyltransferase